MKTLAGGFTGVQSLLLDIPFWLNVSQRSNLAMTPYPVVDVVACHECETEKAPRNRES